MSLCITLQFWQEDRAQADVLAKFIADIEPAYRPDVRIRFLARFDCPQLDMDTIQHVGRKFDVSWAHSKREWTGWPGGCNGLALDALSDGLKLEKNIGWGGITGLLLMEPDCVPLQRDWLTQLRTEWDIARAAGKIIMGSYRKPAGHEFGHINGNCVVVSDFTARMPMNEVGPHLAWDCAISRYIQDRCHPTGLIRNDYRAKDATPGKLRRPEIGERAPVLCHGYRDSSCLDIARSWLL